MTVIDQDLERVRAFKNAARLSDAEFARMASIRSPTTLRHLYEGSFNCTIETLRKLVSVVPREWHPEAAPAPARLNGGTDDTDKPRVLSFHRSDGQYSINRKCHVDPYAAGVFQHVLDPALRYLDGLRADDGTLWESRVDFAILARLSGGAPIHTGTWNGLPETSRFERWTVIPYYESGADHAGDSLATALPDHPIRQCVVEDLREIETGSGILLSVIHRRWSQPRKRPEVAFWVILRLTLRMRGADGALKFLMIAAPVDARMAFERMPELRIGGIGTGSAPKA
jgi:hypothetical protein